MKKCKKVYFEGTAPVYGKAARRLERLIANPPTATAEEIEQMNRDYEYFKSISTCNLL